MRAVAVLTVLVALFIWGGVHVQRYLADTGRQLEEAVQDVLTAAEADEWVTAAQRSRQLQALWRQIKDWWGLLTEHDEIDDINATLSRLQGAVAEQDAATLQAEGAAALQLFRHIPEKESFNLVNIL